MEDGDHSTCSVELLACPEHREEQRRQMGESGTSDVPRTEYSAEGTMFIDEDDAPIVGFLSVVRYRLLFDE
jgi:hypothetical protein